MNRRIFIKRSAQVSAIPLVINGLSFSAFGYSPMQHLLSMATQTDRVLVLIQLNGGNDGLNTVIPIDQYASLSKVRPNILIDEKKVLKLSGLAATGLHPAMTGLRDVYNNGNLAIAQGVSYSKPNFSHFRSTDIWTSASDADVTISNGWLGRYLESEYPNYPTGYPSAAFPDPISMQIGSVVSPVLQGSSASMGMAITSPSNFYNLVSGTTDPVPNTPAGHELAFIRQTSTQTQAYAATIKNAAAKATNKSTMYPAAGQNSLADQLKIVAQLVAGGLQTRVYVCNLGGFDTHAGQVVDGATDTGEHATLLGKLSEAIAAFQDDLKLLAVHDRVLGMTFSEFGRRIISNASVGTDHGAGAPLFIFGSKVPGNMYGNNPQINPNATVQDNIDMQWDFRSPYTTVLQWWFGLPKEKAAEVLGREFPLLWETNTGSKPIAENAFDLTCFPNPVGAGSMVTFNSASENLSLCLLDVQGKEVSVLNKAFYPQGRHQFYFDAGGLPAGSYFLQLQGSISNGIIKILKQ